MASLPNDAPNEALIAPSRATPLVAALLTVPLLAHAVVLATAIGRLGYQVLDAIDFAVLGLTLAVLSALMFCLKRPKHLPRLLLVVYSSVVALGVGELLVRTLIPVPPGGLPWPPMAVTSTAADTMTGISGRIDFTVNRLGVRGPEVNLDEVDLRILCVGGSTTECRYVTDEASWPWRLGDMLSECLDRRVFVGNAGKAAHIVRQHEYLLRHYERAEEFDWVVVFCGFNDMAVGLADAYTFFENNLSTTLTCPHRERYPLGRYYRNLDLFHHLTRIMKRETREGTYHQDAGGKWYEKARQARHAALAKRTIHEPPDHLPEMLERYRRDVRSLIGTARARDLKIVFVTQPSRFGEDLPEEVTDTFMAVHSAHEGYSPAAYAKMLDAFNATLMEVCREEDVPCIDLAAKLPRDETVFYDDHHFNISGCARVAEVLRDDLCGRLAKSQAED